MKILLLTDQLDNWSCHNRCKKIKELLPEYNFDIVNGTERGGALLSCFNNYDLIHFNYTAGICEYYKRIIEHPRQIIITVVNERSVFDGFGISDMNEFNEIVKRCNIATSVSKKVANHFGIEWIPNGVDLKLFKTNKPIVGYCGTVGIVKNFDMLKKVCEDLGLGLKVALYGDSKLPHESMPDFYRGLDVFVHLSNSEGCSNVVLEALAMNVPVIKTKTGIWDEYVDYVTFVETTYDSVKNALNKLLSRKVIETKFNWKDIILRYKEVYERAYKRKEDESVWV